MKRVILLVNEEGQQEICLCQERIDKLSVERTCVVQKITCEFEKYGQSP